MRTRPRARARTSSRTWLTAPQPAPPRERPAARLLAAEPAPPRRAPPRPCLLRRHLWEAFFTAEPPEPLPTQAALGDFPEEDSTLCSVRFLPGLLSPRPGSLPCLRAEHLLAPWTLRLSAGWGLGAWCWPGLTLSHHRPRSCFTALEERYGPDVAGAAFVLKQGGAVKYAGAGWGGVG